MDEPQSNPSSVPLYFLCQLARRHVTVVLSGEGADEIYAGYEWYADIPAMQQYKRLPAGLRHLASDASQRLPYFKGHDFIIKGSGRPEDWFIGQALVYTEKEAYDILKPKYRVGPTARERQRAGNPYNSATDHDNFRHYGSFFPGLNRPFGSSARLTARAASTAAGDHWRDSCPAFRSPIP